MICFTFDAKVLITTFLKPPSIESLAFVVIFSQEVDKPNMGVSVFFEKIAQLVDKVDGNPLRIHILPSPGIKKYQELFKCQTNPST